MSGGSTVTLDDLALLLRARDDGAGFLAPLERPARIDEFQRAGEGLLLAVKAATDETIDREAVRPQIERSPGPELRRFLRLQSAGGTNATTRAKRAPKVHLVDSGLAASLLGLGEREFGSLDRDRELGFLLENFVVTELRKQASWSDRSVDVLHFRDRNGPEVDVIVEQRATGAIAGIEVKASMMPRVEHARHLALLRDRLGASFSVGVVLHLGNAVLSLGERIWAMPVPALWTPW